MKLVQCTWFWRYKHLFFNFVNVFSIVRYYLPLKKDVALYFYRLKFPSPKNALCQVWMKLDQLLWRRFFFISSMSYLSPLRKGMTFYLNKLESLSHNDALCQVWLKLTQWCWRIWWKCGNLQANVQTDDGQSEKFTRALNIVS